MNKILNITIGALVLSLAIFGVVAMSKSTVSDAAGANGAWHATWANQTASAKDACNLSTLAVQDSYKGASSKTITLFHTGDGNHSLKDDPAYSVGEQYVLFLSEQRADGRWVVTSPEGRHLVSNGTVRNFSERPAVAAKNGMGLDAFLADLSFEWLVNPDDRAVFQVYGGPGYGWVNFDPPTGKDDDDNVLTLHFGVGAKISITDEFYIRPDARIRWFDADEDPAGGPDDSHTDLEATIGFGWYLGGGD
jgi:hypothetical protein